VKKPQLFLNGMLKIVSIGLQLIGYFGLNYQKKTACGFQKIKSESLLALVQQFTQQTTN
jgi:hypothetical protein